jgi:hypothetical protein
LIPGEGTMLNEKLLLAFALLWVASLNELAYAAGFVEQALNTAITARENRAKSQPLDKRAYSFFIRSFPIVSLPNT